MKLLKHIGFRPRFTLSVSKCSTKVGFFPERSRRVQSLGLVFIGLMLAFMLTPEYADAQCSMCRATTNSNQLSDDAFTVGNGLNNGIVYLMFIPYIMAGIFLYAFYGKQIKAWFKSKFSN